MNSNLLKFPPHLTIDSAPKLIKPIEDILKKDREDLTLDFRSVSEIDVFGLAVIARFLCAHSDFKNEFNNYLYRDLRERKKHDIKLPRTKALRKILKETGILDALSSTGIETLWSVKEAKTDRWILVPEVLDSKDRGLLLGTQVGNHIKEDSIRQAFKYCVGELVSNFWAHSLDNRTVIASSFNSSWASFVLVDRGVGIPGTLLSAKDKFGNSIQIPGIKKGEQRSHVILKTSICRDVTSKPHFCHQGAGLYYVSRITEMNGGHFALISGGGRVDVRGGKSHDKRTSLWNGTIAYLRLRFDGKIDSSKIFDKQFNIKGLANIGANK